MSILFILVPVAAILAALAVAAFIWSVRRGQMDDLETPALRILTDDVPVEPAPPAAGRPGHAPGERCA